MSACMLISFQLPIYAEENNPIALLSTTYSVDEGDRVLYFESQESMDLYLKYVSQNTGARAGGDYDVTWNEVVNGTETRTDGWIGTVTSDWAFASSYTLSASKEYSATLSASYKNVSFSVGASKIYEYSVTIAANSQYRSKLALWQTYTVTSRTITYYVNGVYWRAETYNVVTKSGDATIGACYESIYPVCGSAL